VLWIGVWALLATSVPAGATTLTWSVVPSPNPGSGYNILNAVSCASPAVCTAVGYDRAGNPFHTVIESWNGAKWSVVPGPAVGLNLNGVSCVPAAACTAVGSAKTGSGALLESWNGTSWSVVPSPHPANSTSVLYGVSCVSVAACTAVGSYYPLNSGQFKTFVESWNGTAWSVVPSPNRPSGNVLDGVSCVSAAACTAVGYHGDRRSTRSLIESWNGTAWSLVTSPNPGSDYDNLYGVSCPSAAVCTAVGKYANPGVEQTLIESWNGTKWSVTHSPSPGTVDVLNGVSCASAATCTAAGSNGRNSQTSPATLIESGR
jgi:hypothetical protein